MDPTHFDDLTRLLGRSGGRRTVLGVLLGALLGPAAAEAARKRRQDRAKAKDRGRDKDRDREAGRQLEAERRGQRQREGGKRRKPKKKRGGNDGGQPQPSPDCCGTRSCPDPEPGSASAGCAFGGRNFTGQDHNGSAFRGIDGREANFNSTANHGSVFAEACLQGASFRRARLDGSTWGDACLFDADFTGADFGGDLTLFNDARFCDTTMPDGSTNDRDCGRGAACCRAELGGGDPCQTAADCGDEACRTKACQNGQCVYTVVADGPDPSGECGGGTPPPHCCEGVCCAPGATACNPLGLCCAPNCANRECGPDGCGGGTCGICQAGQACDDSGQCVCTRQSCPDGCCANGPGNPGTCQPGTTNQACGDGGTSCASCGAGEACLNQQCAACTPDCSFFDGTPTTEIYTRSSTLSPHVALPISCASGQCVCAAGACKGCCENGPGNPGFCVPFSPPFCVGGGGACVQCGGDNCCDPITGTCQPGDTPQTCGSAGRQCAVCPAGTPCVNHFCACDAATCGGGCCDDTGSCQPGDGGDQHCGSGGEACVDCGQFGSTCIVCCGQRCATVDGCNCSVDSDCCSGNCFNGVCAERVTQCGSTVCDPPANGCGGDTCCTGTANHTCGDVCCERPCCGDSCCIFDQNCCGDDVCCNDPCCGDSCCDASGNPCCGGVCCDNACCSDGCCGLGQTCCGENGPCCGGAANSICCDTDSGLTCCTDPDAPCWCN